MGLLPNSRYGQAVGWGADYDVQILAARDDGLAGRADAARAFLVVAREATA